MSHISPKHYGGKIEYLPIGGDERRASGNLNAFFSSRLQLLKDSPARLGCFAAGAILVVPGAVIALFAGTGTEVAPIAPYVVQKGDTPWSIGTAVKENTGERGDLRHFADSISKQQDGKYLQVGETVMVNAAADVSAEPGVQLKTPTE